MPEFHFGRLLDHVQLSVSDLARSRRFWEPVLTALGRGIVTESPKHFSSDELWVEAVKPGAAPTHVHLALQAPDRETVQRFHAAAVAAGGTDNGAPGERPYHPGYYAAFVLDPDGNNIEAVYHGPGDRSAPSVVIQAKLP